MEHHYWLMIIIAYSIIDFFLKVWVLTLTLHINVVAVKEKQWLIQCVTIEAPFILIFACRTKLVIFHYLFKSNWQAEMMRVKPHFIQSFAIRHKDKMRASQSQTRIKRNRINEQQFLNEEKKQNPAALQPHRMCNSCDVGWQSNLCWCARPTKRKHPGSDLSSELFSKGQTVTLIKRERFLD